MLSDRVAAVSFLAYRSRVLPTLNLFEILVIAAIALVVIGPEQLPSVMRALAKTIRELRAAANEVMRELDESFQDEPAPPKRSPESATTAAPQIESEAAPKSPSN